MMDGWMDLYGQFHDNYHHDACFIQPSNFLFGINHQMTNHHSNQG